MFSTRKIIGILCVGLGILQIILWAWLLRFGLRWAKVPDVTTRDIIQAIVPQLAIVSYDGGRRP
ncbi:MAG: hypothetical protein KDA87_08585 [Planctomycetales bacterium]|nr:hypothetical protein [Planctomycetales bacterium]